SNEKLFSLGVKYLDCSFNAKENFLYIGAIKDKTVDTIFKELISELKEYDILEQVTFISTDGEISISSIKNGVVGKFTKLIPWIMHVHCRAHCTNLGLTDTIKQKDFLDQSNKTIFKLFQFFNRQLSDNLKERFIMIKDIELFISFDLLKIKQLDKKLIEAYCIDEVKYLIKHYQKFKQNDDEINFFKYNQREAFQEYQHCKYYINSNKDVNESLLLSQIKELSRYIQWVIHITYGIIQYIGTSYVQKTKSRKLTDEEEDNIVKISESNRDLIAAQIARDEKLNEEKLSKTVNDNTLTDLIPWLSYILNQVNSFILFLLLLNPLQSQLVLQKVINSNIQGLFVWSTVWGYNQYFLSLFFVQKVLGEHCFMQTIRVTYYQIGITSINILLDEFDPLNKGFRICP
ncbi:hypothetical protein ABPG72_012091, partial [Tetrahymena utriculariae]